MKYAEGREPFGVVYGITTVPINFLLSNGATLLLLLCASATYGADLNSGYDEFFNRTATAQDLEQQRGRANQQFNLMSVEGAVHSNTASNSVNGSNLITNGSFANANGLATAIQNSGNNVLIQNATILTIDLR